MLHIVDHPLVQHKLSIMRNKNTSTNEFRELLREISLFMGYEVTRDFPLTYEEIETPLMKMNAPNPSVEPSRGSCEGKMVAQKGHLDKVPATAGVHF